MIKNRNSHTTHANTRQGQARTNGGRRRSERDPHAGPLMHEGTPLFKLSRREQEQQRIQQAQGPNKPSYPRDSNGDINGNVVLDQQSRSCNKKANAQASQSVTGQESIQARTGKADDTNQKSVKAKKLRLRGPNQDLKDKVKRLREVRIDLDNIEPVRLQKALAASGVGSRREMEEWIEAGQITINGKKASLGERVGPRDRVTVKSAQVQLKWPDRLPRVIMYHKEEGEIVSRDDPEGRVTVFDRLPQAKSSRWVAIGRLDINTSGLLLITTSGELANCMMHPSFEVEREYSVRVLGTLTPEIIKQMIHGVELEDGKAHFDRIFQKSGSENAANQWFNVVVKEGRNREVRRIFEYFGLTVSRLIRVRFGRIGLPPRLKRGQFYELNSAEVASVMRWSNLTVTGSKKVDAKKKVAPNESAG